jgi:riboflavin kinase/FMN adenylyltransferase
MFPLAITGVVEPGMGLATSLGCPTANLAPEEGLIIPGMGVYLGWTDVEGKRYASVLCVGAGRDQSSFKIEVHLMDVCVDLRGKRLKVEIVSKLRDLIPWPGEDQMKGMIAEDLVHAREWFADHV